MSTCKRINKLIPLYISDDLETADKTLVQEHLEQCPICQKEVETYRSLKDALARSGLPAPTQGFWDNYWTELETKLQTKPQPLPQPVFKSAWFLWVRYAAVFLFGLAIGYVGYRSVGSSKPSRSEPAPSEFTSATGITTSKIMENKPLGMRFQPVSQALSEHLQLPPGQGVVIYDFFNHSPFQEAGFQPADIILELNGQPILNPEIFSSNVISQGTNNIKLKIIRYGKVITKQIIIKPDIRGGEEK